MEGKKKRRRKKVTSRSTEELVLKKNPKCVITQPIQTVLMVF